MSRYGKEDRQVLLNRAAQGLLHSVTLELVYCLTFQIEIVHRQSMHVVFAPFYTQRLCI